MIDFEVVKVVIKGNLPASCDECFYCYSLIAQCEVMNKPVYCIDYKNTRPDWCPLVVGDRLLFEHSIMKRWIKGESESE